MERVKVKAREGQNRCPYCMDDLSGDVFECTCGAGYHVACTEELKSCAVLGCERQLKPRKKWLGRRERSEPFLREGRGPVVTRSFLPAELAKTAKVVGAILLVLFLLWAGMQAPGKQRPGQRPARRVGEIPAYLIQHREQAIFRLDELIQLRAFIETTTARERGHEEQQYQQMLSDVLSYCDNTPLAGGPAAFKAYVRQDIMRNVRPDNAQHAQRVLQDFFGAPGW